MLQTFKLGQASIVVRPKLLNTASTLGAGLTGLTSASSGLIISTIADNEATATTYTQAGSTIETITTLGTYAAPTATKCRFKEVDATNHKGIYEFQFADARYAVSNAKSLLVSVSGVSGLQEMDFVIQLQSDDPYVAKGVTAVTIASGGIIAASFAASAITASAIASDAITDAKVASDVTIASVTGAVGSVTGAVGSVTGNVGGNVTGSVGSVVGAVGSVTGFTASDITLIKTATNTGVAPGAAGGLFIAGTNAATTITTALTTTFTGSLTGSVASVTGAAGSVTGNVGGNVVGSVGSVTGAVGSVTGNVGGNVVGSVASVTAAVAMTSNIKKNQALASFQFLMTDSTNHAPVTGKTVTCTRAIDSGTQAAGTLANVTEGANGTYLVDFGAGDLNGNVIILRATASGCDDTFERIVTQP